MVSTGRGTRRVRLVREEGRGVSSQYGREGEGEGGCLWRDRSPSSRGAGGARGASDAGRGARGAAARARGAGAAGRARACAQAPARRPVRTQGRLGEGRDVSA